MKIKSFLTVLSLCVSAGLLANCSANPATGRTQFTGLMSPAQEQIVGAQEHPNIIAEFGEYQNPRLSAYVQEIGTKVTRDTERPDVQYRFFVLDSPIVNAFALPGGYIYLSRGLLALANNEAEMASVLGHEAGHITGRHSAERYSRGVVTGLGVGILAAAIDRGGASQALGIGADLYLKSYSRAQEHEADSLGIRYMAQSGYDPLASASFLQSLQMATEFEAQLDGRQQASMSYFSTHPATSERVQRASSEASIVRTNGALNRDRYLDMIDGMTYGESAKHGFVREQDFIHPEIGFRFSVPNGFRISNQPSQVVATSQSGAVVIFDMAQNQGGQDPLSYLTQNWLKNPPSEPAEAITINGMRAATAGFQGSVNNQPMTIRLVAIEFAPRQFARFQIGIPQGAAASVVEDLKRTTYSFAKLSEAEKNSFRPYVLRVVTARSGDTIASMAARFTYERMNVERFRVLNALAPNAQIVPGQRYKIIAAQ
ncbi:MAG: M48 family metalloprotease [Alphaproteobacteria bacterium]